MPNYTHLGNNNDGTAAIQTLLAAAEQPGTKLQHEKRNLLSVTSTFQFAGGDIQTVLSALTGSTHPRYSFAGYQSSGQITEMEGGLYQMSALFQGSLSDLSFDGDNSDENELLPPPVFETQVVSGEEPLATNPYYDTLSALQKSDTIRLAQDPDLVGAYPAEYEGWSDQQKHLYDKLITGVTAWDSPRDLYMVRYNSTQPVTGALWKKRGRIIVPWGNPPKLPSDRNWRLTSITQVQTGLSYDISIGYTASGPGKWDEKLYTEPAA